MNLAWTWRHREKVIILAWLALSTEVESRILVIFRHRRSLINYTHHVEEVWLARPRWLVVQWIDKVIRDLLLLCKEVVLLACFNRRLHKEVVLTLLSRLVKKIIILLSLRLIKNKFLLLGRLSLKLVKLGLLLDWTRLSEEIIFLSWGLNYWSWTFLNEYVVYLRLLNNLLSLGWLRYTQRIVGVVNLLLLDCSRRQLIRGHRE